jgi:hypothetical protein
MTTCKECVALLLGACRGDFCEPERMGLAEMVERLAAEGGHTLASFRKEPGRPLWHVACRRCALEASYTLDPEPGMPAISGPLLDTPCESTNG